MVTIGIKKNSVKYSKYDKIFFVSGKRIVFASDYRVVNEKTNNFMDFKLKYSTGSEWDPNTVWVYESSDDADVYRLFVLNDDVTQKDADNYLAAKLKNM